MSKIKYLKSTAQEVEVLHSFTIHNENVHCVRLIGDGRLDLGSFSAGGGVTSGGDGEPIYNDGIDIDLNENVTELEFIVRDYELIDNFNELRESADLKSLKLKINEENIKLNLVKKENEATLIEKKNNEAEIDKLNLKIIDIKNDLVLIESEKIKQSESYLNIYNNTKELESKVVYLKDTILKYEKFADNDKFKVFETMVNIITSKKENDNIIPLNDTENLMILRLKDVISEIFIVDLKSNKEDFVRLMDGNIKSNPKYNIEISEENSNEEYYQKGQFYKTTYYKIIDNSNPECYYTISVVTLCDKDGYINCENVYI